MSASPFTRLAEQIADEVEAEIMAAGVYLESNWAAQGCESPIELLFLHAFSATAEFCRKGVDFGICYHQPLPDEPAPYVLFIERQKQIGEFRVDFLVTQYATWSRIPQNGKSRGWRSLIVECDGHNFHERTKEQAARDRSRDRSLVMSGHEVFRFTGSELWRDPMKCALQVLDWAEVGV